MQCHLDLAKAATKTKNAMRAGAAGRSVKLARARELKSACEVQTSGIRRRLELKGSWRPDKATEQKQLVRTQRLNYAAPRN